MKATILLLFLIWKWQPDIVIRHDKADSDFQNLARQFESKLCHLNLGRGVPDGEGTLIHRHWVLTAAHCAVDLQKKLDKRENHFVTIAGVEHRVDRVILHERWIENEAYDIALVHIEEPSMRGEIVKIYTDKNELGQLVYVAGLGDKGTGVTGITGNDNKLRAATNRVDEATDFWLKWAFDNPATNPGKATELEGISGPGDSGGPAFINVQGETYIVGISSGQSARNSNGKEGVYGVVEYYTRVSMYVDWIKKNMN